MSGSYFGHGDLPMLVGETYCYGYEPDLNYCYGLYYRPRSVPRSCDSSHVAGVRCFGEQKKKKKIFMHIAIFYV